MKIKVCKTTNPIYYEKVNPNFIYNRFDLFLNSDEFETIVINNNSLEKVIEYRITSDTAELGLWLVDVTTEELEHILLYIKNNHSEVNKVVFKNSCISYGKSKAHNHFRIVFPHTVEEMVSKISSKSRAKMRKKLNRAQEQFGQMEIIEYDKSNLPNEIVDLFFKFKFETRGRIYNMSGREYLEKYHVSHCYAVKFGDTVGALRFSCEQCPVVYGENFAYNPDLKDYSLGRFIFYHHLIRMVEKKHLELFFAGGDYEYKKHYGSIEETLYDCEIDLTNIDLSHLNAHNNMYHKIINGFKSLFTNRKS